MAPSSATLDHATVQAALATVNSLATTDFQKKVDEKSTLTGIALNTADVERTQAVIDTAAAITLNTNTPEPTLAQINLTDWDMDGWRTVTGCQTPQTCWRSYYSHNMVAKLTSQDLIYLDENLIDPYLVFTHRYKTEEDYDICSVRVSIQGSGYWKIIEEYSGEIPWSTTSLSLKGLQGKEIYIQFLFDTDPYITAEFGWAIQNVMIVSSGDNP